VKILKGIAVGAGALLLLSMAIFDYPPPLFHATWWKTFLMYLIGAWIYFVWNVSIDYKLAKLRDELLAELRDERERGVFVSDEPR
jgi:hypothetical protein